mmetsp:Transcript_14810/g.24487  ORF Transcript_14810/g.24487 Transcript_14810/m.24487 type:complete len:106 (+) Transcript_14810:138-455(+)
MPTRRSFVVLFLYMHCQSASCWNTPQPRRTVLDSTIAASWALLISSCAPAAANAAETIGKDSTCNDKACLGVWDGLLADCPHDNLRMGAGCASSQDDYPGVFAEP